MFEEPILLLGTRIIDRRFADCDLVVREDALAEYILTVTLLEYTPLLDCHADH